MFALFLFSLALFSQNEMSGELFDLAKIKNGVRNRRISSYDRTGGNADNVSGIKPGEKRTIAEISGKGVINHIWITIAPPPGELSRNDIILRMYWDGNEYPSVESPIGPFFRSRMERTVQLFFLSAECRACERYRTLLLFCHAFRKRSTHRNRESNQPEHRCFLFLCRLSRNG